jgi:2-polyprenyl-3-methyl-5-hydroxy-6-metoxy-1,4-benzoquinol methylase
MKKGASSSMSMQTETQQQDLHRFRHLQHILTYHEQLLSDRVRNQSFQRALKKHVSKDTSVLDIGSGSGVWAIAAAKLGASRVVAIEREKLLIPIIEKLAFKNGVKDKVEVLEGDSRSLKISGKFDVIVSETVGNHAFDEDIVPIIIDAKKRFLKKGGVVIPCALAAVTAPAHLPARANPLPAGLKLEFNYLETLCLDIPRKVNNQSQVKMLGVPSTLTRVDLISVTAPPNLTEMACKWRLKDASQLNCLIVWAEIQLTDRVSLQTIRHSKGWTPVCLPVDPFEKGPAVIECTITISNKQYYWIVAHVKNGRRVVQSHSPVFPYTVIQAHAQKRDLP